jgi:hypothetical protein
MPRKFQIGDTVKVKQGTIDPDFGFEIGGWHGEVTEIDDGMACIELDSITLSEIPDKYFTKCEIDGLDWERIYLGLTDVELSERRDTEEDLTAIRKEIELNHEWDDLEGSGKIVSEVLKNIDSGDESKVLKAWKKYLSENLSFPFDGKIAQYQNKGPLQQGDKIRIHGILGYEDGYGVIVKLRFGKKGHHFPLHYMEALDKTSENEKIIETYSQWFVNR